MPLIQGETILLNYEEIAARSSAEDIFGSDQIFLSSIHRYIWQKSYKFCSESFRRTHRETELLGEEVD